MKSWALSLVLLLWAMPALCLASALRDEALRKGLQPLDPPSNLNSELFDLGEKLFFDKNLSGNRNVSCATCHHPQKYSADGFGLSLGFAPGNLNKNETFRKALKRHSPTLINVGDDSFRLMMWDGRIAVNPTDHVLKTPEEGLNGLFPLYADIAKNLKKPAALQALFPLIEADEMKGYPGENEIADAKDNFQAWERLTQRILSVKEYKTAFITVYPNEEINISHLTQALAHFIENFFYSTETSLDQFLRGDETVLSDLEKQGLTVFLNKGQCVACHTGKHLTNFTFQSVGAPQILADLNSDDWGREEVTKEKRSRYKFKTPGLRNIALTAPYFHSGAVRNLKDLIEHYNSIVGSLNAFVLDLDLKNTYGHELYYDQTRSRNELRVLQARPTPLRIGLNLTAEEKEALHEFLSLSLTDRVFKERMENFVEPITP